MIRFVHAADLHLDSPFRGLTRQAEEVGTQLRRATIAAFENLIDLCLREEIDFLLIAGDVYDGQDRSLRAQLAFRDGLTRLAERSIPSFVVHGNHDPTDSWTASIDWPPEVTIFSSSESSRIQVVRRGEPVAEVSGISYAHRNEDRKLHLELQPGDSSLFQIALLHANCGGSQEHEAYVPCQPDELAGIGFDYWALGHVHERRNWNLSSRIVYPGNLQGRSVRETGPRGAYLVEVDSSRDTTLTFHDLDEVRWAIEKIDIADLETIDDLEMAIEHRIDDLRESSGQRSLVVRLLLEGSGPLAGELQRLGAIEDLLERLRTAPDSSSPLLWIESLRETTRTEIDLDSRRGQKDLAGHLLEIADGIRALESMPQDLEERLACLFGHRIGRRILEPIHGPRLESLLADAERLCLGLLDEPE